MLKFIILSQIAVWNIIVGIGLTESTTKTKLFVLPAILVLSAILARAVS